MWFEGRLDSVQLMSGDCGGPLLINRPEEGMTASNGNKTIC